MFNKVNSRLATNRTQVKLFDRIQGRMVKLVVCLVFTLMFVQFLILGTVGTLGPKISSLRSEREKLHLSNELKQANIREAQTKGQIVDIAANDLEMKGAELKRLEVAGAEASAVARY